MKHIFHKEDAEVVRIEGEAPRTLYTRIQMSLFALKACHYQ